VTGLRERPLSCDERRHAPLFGDPMRAMTELREDVAMTGAEAEEVRTRVLLAACAFGAAALLAVVVLLVLGLKVSGPTGIAVATPTALPGGTTPARADAALTSAARQRSLFAPTSFWNAPLPAAAPTDPKSPALVGALVAEVLRERAAGIGPWIGTGAGSTPIYRVPADQPRVRVSLAGGTLRGRRALQRAFASVPIPRDATPAPGADRHLTVVQPSTDSLWELFGARHGADGWHASWGGAIRRVSKSPGYYTAAAWPGASRNWGATASSLPVIGGTMLLAELKSGRIDHALAINLPAPRAGVFAWPAQRTDGTGAPTTLPEGARLRLDPAVDVSRLHLPKLTRMIALAAQRYGLVVRDQTHNGISFFGEVRADAKHDYEPFFQGRTPLQLLADFPWARLQVLAMHLCTKAPCHER
jgi:hypothetical protein